MKFFRIKTGYNEGDFVSIDDTELEIALHIFMTDGKAIFKNGVVRGKDIIAINEDWHKAMGINPLWKLDADDWNEIGKRGIRREYANILQVAKDRVQYLVQSGQENLIGKGVKIPELESEKGNQPSGATQALAKKMSI